VVIDSLSARRREILKQNPGGLFVARLHTLQTELCNFLHASPSNEYAALVIPSLSVLVHSGGRLKFVDICVIGLVSIVCLNRFPFPLRSLELDLISNSRLTMLSAVCQLVGLLDACDYFAGRLFAVKGHHPGWIAVEIIVWLSSGLLFGPACRSFFSGLFFNKRVRTEPVKKLHLSL
jgi:hypothetical protein